MSKTVIVTGGLGFIGSNLIKLLIKKNYFVINVDKVNYASNFYNTRSFSKKKNYKFKTNSDTEVLLKAYQEYGEKCVDHFIGMWAFAIYDIKKKKTLLIKR